MSFEAWGQRRNAQDWEVLVADALKNFDHSITTRGFTGHEMLDEVGLVHMNGRIYDARLGRFLQADPVIDSVTSTQGYNRYSYVHNNPLRYTDSSGYSIDAGSVIQIIGNAVLIVFQQYWAIPYWNAFVSGARVAANGGDFGQIATAAFTSYFMSQAAVALGAGGFGANWETLGFAVMGGITSEINGGQFGHGFISAGVGAIAGAAIGDPGAGWELAGQTLASMVVAGTISEMTGGKFANGAMYAAFSAVAGMVGSNLQDVDGADDPTEKMFKANESLRDNISYDEDGNATITATVSSEAGQETQRDIFVKKVSGVRAATGNCNFLGFGCKETKTLTINLSVHEGDGVGDLHVVSREGMSSLSAAFAKKLSDASACQFACASVANKYIYINDMKLSGAKLTHEVFHNFGFYHGNRPKGSFMHTNSGRLDVKDLDELRGGYGL